MVQICSSLDYLEQDCDGGLRRYSGVGRGGEGTISGAGVQD